MMKYFFVVCWVWFTFKMFKFLIYVYDIFKKFGLINHKPKFIISSHIKPKMHHVAVCHDVGFAF